MVLLAIILGFAGWVFFSTNSGTSTTKTETPSGTTGLSSLFPFGKNTDSTTPPETGTTPPSGTGTIQIEGITTTSPIPLFQLSTHLVAGFSVLPVPPPAPKKSVFDIKTNSVIFVEDQNPLPIIRFAESGTGYIYDIDAKGQNEKKISDTTIARTSRAFFADNGSSVALQYIKTDNQTVATFLGRLVPPASGDTVGSLKGSFLPENLFDISPSPDGKSLLYLLPSGEGLAGITMKTDGTSKKQIFSSSFTEWLLDWKKGATVVTTKAASGEAGYAYKITSAGDLQKIIGGIKGLTTNISPDGNYLLYSVGEGNKLDLHVMNLKDLSSNDLGLPTLPEKCVWSKNSLTIYCGATNGINNDAYPDSWYQGTSHFNDIFWKADAKTGSTIQISGNNGNYLDVTKPALDSKELYLFFVNKNDGTLWSLEIAKASSIDLPALR